MIGFFRIKRYYYGMGNRATQQKGFTILELLVVVVIIGIIAALVLVVYNSITKRALNEQTAFAVAAYKKALIQYATTSGSYPVNSSFCLGEGYPASGCGSSNSIPQNASVNNLLRPYFGNSTLPLPNTRSIPYGGTVRTGAWFNYQPLYTLDGQSHRWFIAYMMEGYQTKCTGSGVLSIAGSGSQYSSNPPSSGYTVTSMEGSYCLTALPDPATL